MEEKKIPSMKFLHSFMLRKCTGNRDVVHEPGEERSHQVHLLTKKKTPSTSWISNQFNRPVRCINNCGLVPNFKSHIHTVHPTSFMDYIAAFQELVPLAFEMRLWGKRIWVFMVYFVHQNEGMNLTQLTNKGRPK